MSRSGCRRVSARRSPVGSPCRALRFDPLYRPAPGIASAIVGTPPILSLAALEIGIDLALEADLAAVRAKSLALAHLFVERVTESCAGFG